ncbi:hypothetical protein Leryth_020851 [Lithospermum erythrorhizon]|nr:hypothetical protein Leryth_020851 [Lithospermum erythrorhizon]
MDMASVAVELALNQAYSVLGDHEFISNVENFKEELHLLVGNLKMVKSFLLDAESKNLDTEAVKGWLQIVEASLQLIFGDLLKVLMKFSGKPLRSPKKKIESVMVDKIKEINLAGKVAKESVCVA